MKCIRQSICIIAAGKAAGKGLQPPKTSDIQEGFAFNRYESKEITGGIVQSKKTICETVAAGAL